MIKVPYSLTELDLMAKDYYKVIEKEFDIRDQLQKWPNDELKPVMTFLEANLDTVMIGRPDQLEIIMTSLKASIDTAKQLYITNHPTKTDGSATKDSDAKAWFKAQIFQIFNYDNNSKSFISKNKGKLAYDHAAILNMNTCPYCNANFTFTIKSKKLKSRPQFDHFFNKGRHPYLALSFYNLIPSCALCNSGALKGQKEFTLKKNIHPFLESIENTYEFRTKVDAVDFLVSKKNFTLEMVLCNSKKDTDPDVIKAKGNLEIFALNDRYSYHKDIAESVIRNAHIYCNSTIKDLYETFEIKGKKIFTSEQEIKELVIGNYLDLLNSHKRIHSKLVRDIADEFGLTV